MCSHDAFPGPMYQAHSPKRKKSRSPTEKVPLHTRECWTVTIEADSPDVKITQTKTVNQKLCTQMAKPGERLKYSQIDQFFGK